MTVPIMILCAEEAASSFRMDQKLRRQLLALADTLLRCLPCSLYSSIDLIKLTRCYLSLVSCPSWAVGVGYQRGGEGSLPGWSVMAVHFFSPLSPRAEARWRRVVVTPTRTLVD